jgi:transcriptional regulator with XRE-family HTH domain
LTPNRKQVTVPLVSDLANRIRHLREERGLSIEPAANMLEPRTTGKTWSKWERGLEEPSLRNFRAICRFFDVSGDYLLGWSPRRGHAQRELGNSRRTPA